MSTGTPWRVRLPGASRTLRFDPADPDRHTALLHDWLHRPHVSPWWGPERTLRETRDYIERQRGSAHLTPWVVTAGTLPFGYVETYRAAEDPLAEAYPLEASDRGWHVLVGPDEVRGRGLPRLMGRAVLARLLTEPSGGEPGVTRVVCEPDERNGRMIAYCHALGYETLTHVDLGDKRAALLACTREAFVARWPGDLEAGAASHHGPDGREGPGDGADGRGGDGNGLGRRTATTEASRP
jgi:acetyl CoA:N6-hydroxylysine acetyl transferase